jgi:hypothetical protein
MVFGPKMRFLAFGRIYKWPNPERRSTCSRALIPVHLLWIRPISPCNRFAKKRLQRSGENFRVFDKNHEFCMNLNFFDIFRNIGRISSFRPFDHSAQFFSAFSIFTEAHTLKIKVG